MPGLSVEVLGLQKVQEKLERNALLGGPLHKLFGKAALLVEREAKIKASGRPGPNVRTGRLRASITPEIDSSDFPTYAKVGTNVKYASFVEYGHQQEPGRYVPAIERRLVASEAPAYPFLIPAFEKMKDKINSLLSEFCSLVERGFGK